MNIPGTIEAFRKGTLELDCPNMTFRQRKEGGEVFKGSGYIKQKSDGSLEFKLYVASTTNARKHRQIERYGEIKPGRIVAADAFYELAATTVDRTKWKSERILGSFKSNLEGQTKIVSGSLSTITADVKHPHLHYNEATKSKARLHFLDLHYFDEYDLPCRYQQESEFELDGIEGVVRKQEGASQTSIEMEAATAFLPSFHRRIQEALQYVTGKSANWAVCLRGNRRTVNIALASPEKKSLDTKFPAPIWTGSIDYHKHGWKLFGCYLAYVRKQTDGMYWDPVAYHIHNAREASANSIDAAAIGVSVALEAIASLLKKSYGKAEKQRIAGMKAYVLKCIANDSNYCEYSERLEGLLGLLAKRTPKDVLYDLAKKEAIEESYIKAWNWLRNGHVHPSLKDLKRPGPDGYQEILDATRKVEVLIHQLVFHLIGYEGPFTDYGSETVGQNFPNKAYPLTNNGSAAAT